MLCDIYSTMPESQDTKPSDVLALRSEARTVGEEILIVVSQGIATCFLHDIPFFRYEADDKASRRWVLGHLAFYGLATQKQIAKGFAVHRNTVSAALKHYRDHNGVKKEFSPKPKSWTAIDESTCQRLGKLLAAGVSIRKAAKQCQVNHETVRRYLHAGRIPGAGMPEDKVKTKPLTQPNQSENELSEATSDRTDRDQGDRQAAMGMGAHNVNGRVAASLGMQEGPKPQFSAVKAVKNAGVLVALPALLEAGLLSHTDQLPKTNGYYRQISFLLFLAFMLLARVSSAEQIRYHSPGEWGRILGSDRCPEVKTIRRRIRKLATQEAMNSWQSALAKNWTLQDPEATATLYLDGHVKVYNGRKGKLPVHFVPRQKLCLPAATSYWLNALGGTPLLCVHKQVDPKLIQVLQHDILPQLRTLGLRPASLPKSDNSTVSSPVLTLVFDREGWSPKLFAELARQGVACLTWRKGKSVAWSPQEFETVEVSVPGPCGSVKRQLRLAEKSIALKGSDLKMREIRCLRDDGHQSSMITTNQKMKMTQVAGTLLSRWSQENFFLYARREFGLDHLPTHELEEVNGEEIVVNPNWRRNKKAINQLESKLYGLNKRLQRRIEKNQKITELQQEEFNLRPKLQELKATTKTLSNHVKAKELSSSDRLESLPKPIRLFHDLIRMIVYRAETALMPYVYGQRKVRPNPRSLLKALFKTDADLIPDKAKGELVVRLQNLGNKGQNHAVRELLEVLNQKQVKFPETDLKLVYKIAD